MKSTPRPFWRFAALSGVFLRFVVAQRRRSCLSASRPSQSLHNRAWFLCSSLHPSNQRAAPTSSVRQTPLLERCPHARTEKTHTASTLQCRAPGSACAAAVARSRCCRCVLAPSFAIERGGGGKQEEERPSSFSAPPPLSLLLDARAEAQLNASWSVRPRPRALAFHARRRARANDFSGR